MAIRYSADVECRVQWDPRRRAYVGTVRGLARSGHRGIWEELRWPPGGDRGSVAGSRPTKTRLSEAYDDAARRLIEQADAWARRHGWAFEVERSTLGGRVQVERVFKAPCPVLTTRLAGDRGRDRRASRGRCRR